MNAQVADLIRDLPTWKTEWLHNELTKEQARSDGGDADFILALDRELKRRQDDPAKGQG